MTKIYLESVLPLVVGGNPDDLKLIYDSLRLSGLMQNEGKASLIFAKTLAEGIAAAQTNKPDVLLLNLSLPDSCGIATVHAMRAILPDVPVVILAEYDDNVLDEAVMGLGAQDFLVKGQFDVNALGRAVRHALMRSALEREQDVKHAAQHQRELTVSIETACAADKLSFARELHDDLGGTLTAMRLKTYLLAEELLASVKTAPLLEHTELLGALVDDAVNAMRRIINNLRPPLLDDFGLMVALEYHTEQFNKSTGIKCKLDYLLDNDVEAVLSVFQSTHLYRIFQEALTNIRKHSYASEVTVEVYGDNGAITMVISDNGHGTPKNHVVHSSSYGLLGMNERIAQLGGELRFGNMTGGGFSLMAKMPIATHDITH